jgi:Flp pilus assembly protein TadG
MARFAGNESGSTAVIFAAAFTMLMGVTAVGIEMARINRVQSTLQHAGDSAALAGARELSMAGTDTQAIANISKSSVQRFVEANTKGISSVVVDTRVGTSPPEVEVKVKAKLDLPFGAVIGTSSMVLSTASTARIAGQPNLCVLGLDTSSIGTINLGGNGNVIAKNCSVFSNSTSTSGLSANGGVMTASTICSAGGVKGTSANFKPTALSDCPTFNDPLAGRAPPPSGACTYSNLKIKGGNVTLSPGVYCGGLSVHSKAVVTMSPGVYVVRDGEFEIGTKATVTGDGVGIYFEGANTSIRFKNDSNLSLRAPVDGPMAGILFFGDRMQPTTTTYTISSENARVLVGTIYLPRAKLLIDATKTVGDLSEYTAIIARVVDFQNGNVVLNTDYSMTPVPVPAGIRGAGQPIALYK